MNIKTPKDHDEQAKNVTVVYRNIMDIMTHQSAVIDRIRDTSVSSRHGLQANLKDVLTDFYKDDVLQPKPSAKLRL